MFDMCGVHDDARYTILIIVMCMISYKAVDSLSLKFQAALCANDFENI